MRGAELAVIPAPSVRVQYLNWALIITLFAACFVSAASDAVFAQTGIGTDRLAVGLLTFIKAKNFANASKMFHYPAGQSAAEREADRTSVADWLKALTVEVGDLDSFGPQPSTQIEDVVSISIAGGDVPYWSSRGRLETQAHRFKAIFRKEHEARLTVHVMNSNGRQEIRSFQFGVPSTKPNVQDFMANLARKLIPKP
jgi:hypothetical protein